MKHPAHLLREGGGALIELALVLPVLAFLTFVVVDLSRAIQMNNVLINVTREGASLMSRSVDSPEFAQYVMNALGDTAMPTYQDAGQSGLYFEQRSAMLVTRIQGRLNAVTRNVDATVTEQYRWNRGGITPVSHLWSCGGNWKSDGSCTMPVPAPVAVLPVPIADGDVIYAVEAFNSYQAMFAGVGFGMGTRVPAVTPGLYAVTMF